MLISTATGKTVDANSVGSCGFALALGCFDGVHLGHAALFDALKSNAGELACAAWTFAPPRCGGRCPVKDKPLILSFEEKLATFYSLGIEYAFVYEFSEVCSLSPRRFVEDILIGECKCGLAVCGYDFRFGARAAGNADTLRDILAEFSVPVKTLGEVTLRGASVRSDAVRKALSAGDIEAVNRMLGRNYSVTSVVVEGKKLGRVLGFPTVNQRFFEGAALPRFGVYAASVSIGDKEYPAVTNIGVRPTVSDKDEFANCETHIIGYSGDLYGCKLSVKLLSFLRAECKFASQSELSAAVAEDIRSALEYFNRRERSFSN